MNYIEYRSNGMVEKTRCMRCKDVIATLKNKIVNGEMKEVLVPWSHYRTYLVLLTDGSRASLPVCQDCETRVSHTEFKVLSQQMRFELMRQQVIAYTGHPNAAQRICAAGRVCKTKEILRKL